MQLYRWFAAWSNAQKRLSGLLLLLFWVHQYNNTAQWSVCPPRWSETYVSWVGPVRSRASCRSRTWAVPDTGPSTSSVFSAEWLPQRCVWYPDPGWFLAPPCRSHRTRPNVRYHYWNNGEYIYTVYTYIYKLVMWRFGNLRVDSIFVFFEPKPQLWFSEKQKRFTEPVFSKIGSRSSYKTKYDVKRIFFTRRFFFFKTDNRLI